MYLQILGIKITFIDVKKKVLSYNTNENMLRVKYFEIIKFVFVFLGMYFSQKTV